MDIPTYVYATLAALALIAVFAVIFIPLLFRRVVPTNEVHIVQSSNRTVSYGHGARSNKDSDVGNTYYHWPSWLPKLGITVFKLQTSVFACDLQNYEAYDKGRLPFTLDVKAFFRIEDSNLAAQRVSSFEELTHQLQAILQGAVRTILASEDIETILSGRAEFGKRFTKEVDDQLLSWGVVTVKGIELMDIRDSKDSRVIANIMEKKKSMIERESRVEVAANKKQAHIAEIEAQREVDMSKQEAEQKVGIRTAETKREVGIAAEQSAQQVATQAAITAERAAEVTRVNTVKAAEIQRDSAIVEAEETKRTTELVAEGQLRATQLAAQGVVATGEAKATSEKLMQMAPVEAQIALAREIGDNSSYQEYLITVERVRAGQVVGVAQAEALKAADIKVIANGGTVEEGVQSIGGLFTAAGGTKLGAMIEGLAQTTAGKAIVDKLTTIS